MSQNELTQVFTGGLNMDVDPRMLPPGDYPYAMNCLVGSSENSNVGDVENVLGNVIANYTSRAGDVIIGSGENQAQETIFFFIYNPSEPDRIIEYDVQTRDVRVILDNDLLNFNPDFPINHVNVMESELYWVDGFNPPRGIDYERAYSFTAGAPPGTADPYLSITEEVLNNGARPPKYPPGVQFIDNPALTTNLLKDDTYKFRTAFKYFNNQISALSPISIVPLRDTNQVGFNDITQQNQIQLDVFAGTNGLVEEIIIYVQINNGKWSEVDRKDRSTVLGSSFTYIFTGNESLDYIDDKYAAKKFDNVPRVANCQEFIGETFLCYANLIEGYELLEDFNISASVQKTAIDPPVALDVKDYVQKTFKHGGVYSVGVSYCDDLGRESNVYSDGNSKFTVPEYILEKNAEEISDLLFRYILNVTINHEPPSWAKYYRIMITPEQEYVNFRQFIDYGNVFQYDKENDNKPYLTFGTAVNYDIQIGDEIELIHNFDPSTKNDPNYMDHAIEFYEQAQGENIMRIIDIQGDRYYYESPYSFVIKRERFYLFEIRTKRPKEDDLFYYELATYGVFFDPGSGKYIHAGEINQVWDSFGNLVTPALCRLDNVGDTYIHIQQIDAIVSSKGRRHRVIGQLPNNQPQPAPSESRVEIDGIYPDVWHPLNDITTYLPYPVRAEYLYWYGESNSEYNGLPNGFVLNPTYPVIIAPPNPPSYTAWKEDYDNQRDYENWFYPRKDPLTSNIPTMILYMEPELNAYFEYQVRTFSITESPIQYYKKDCEGNDLGRVGVKLDGFDPKIEQPVKIIYSNRYFQDTQINGFATFDYDDKDYLSEEFGDIVRIISFGETLKLLQFRKITSIYIAKNEILNADGTRTLIYDNKLLGNKHRSKTPYGCYHPESVIRSGSYVYFWDAFHGKIIAAGETGPLSISDIGMKDYFREWGKYMIDNNGMYRGDARFYMGWNLRHGEIICSIQLGKREETVAFSEEDQRWRTFYSYVPERITNIGLQFITCFNGEIYIHNEGDRCVFYGQPFKNAYIDVVFAGDIRMSKLFMRIVQEANLPWNVPMISTVERYLSNGVGNYEQETMSFLEEKDFQNANGTWVAAFKRNMLTPGYASQELALINGDELNCKALICRMSWENEGEGILNHVMVGFNEDYYNY